MFVSLERNTFETAWSQHPGFAVNTRGTNHTWGIRGAKLWSVSLTWLSDLLKFFSHLPICMHLFLQQGHRFWGQGNNWLPLLPEVEKFFSLSTSIIYTNQTKSLLYYLKVFVNGYNIYQDTFDEMDPNYYFTKLKGTSMSLLQRLHG